MRIGKDTAYKRSMQGTTVGNLSVLAIDLAKTTFQLHGNDAGGKALLRKTVRRGQLEAVVANTPRCIVAMEACGSAHYWAGRFSQYGHEVKLIAPQFVKPFVKGNKNDAADAEAIAEAAVRPSMRFVPVKSLEHLDLQAIHRVRERLMHQRTAVAQETRSILFEHGIALIQGIAPIQAFVADLLADKAKEQVSRSCRETIADLDAELRDTEERIAVLDRRLAVFAASNETAKNLQTIPGVGLITATAILAAVPNPRAFKNGRQFAAWLGLVPAHEGTGGKNKLRGITKRGDRYIRSLLVHGGRSVLLSVERRSDAFATWAKQLKETKGWNKASVAIANKNARVIWAVMAFGQSFDATRTSSLH